MKICIKLCVEQRQWWQKIKNYINNVHMVQKEQYGILLVMEPSLVSKKY